MVPELTIVAVPRPPQTSQYAHIIAFEFQFVGIVGEHHGMGRDGLHHFSSSQV
jgi:hypothetical protein